MLIDLDYGHYWVGPPVTDPLFGSPGTVRVLGGSLLVCAFTQAGPVSLRILIGDNAPGVAEDNWRREWEYVEDVVVANTEDLEVRSWEYGEADPPSGSVVRPGRWAMRFHARGEAKVAAEDNVTQMALEEHLVLIWPAGAEPGRAPVWDEVSGTRAGNGTGTAITGWGEEGVHEFGRVKTPAGCYRLTGASRVAEDGTPVAASAGFVQVGDDDLVVATGTTASFELSINGDRFRPEPNERVGGWWRPTDQGHLFSTRPIRLLDDRGDVPRHFSDPLLPAGRWRVQLVTRIKEADDLVAGLPMDTAEPGARYDQRLLVWPDEAPTRSEFYEAEMGEDGAVEYVYGDEEDDQAY